MIYIEMQNEMQEKLICSWPRTAKWPRTASRYGILYVIRHEALYAESHITHKMAADWKKLQEQVKAK